MALRFDRTDNRSSSIDSGAYQTLETPPSHVHVESLQVPLQKIAEEESCDFVIGGLTFCFVQSMKVFINCNGKSTGCIHERSNAEP